MGAARPSARALTTTALALVESRVEQKRSLPWEQLLTDDLDQDGTAESVMRDDGTQEDLTSGDGIFTASMTRSNIRLVWTVEFNRGRQPGAASLATIEARAIFRTVRDRNVRCGFARFGPIRAMSACRYSHDERDKTLAEFFSASNGDEAS